MTTKIFHTPPNIPIIAVMGNIFKNDIYIENITSTTDGYYSIESLVFYPTHDHSLFPVEENTSIFENHSHYSTYMDMFYKNDPTFFEKYSDNYFCFKVKDKKFNYILVFHNNVQYYFEE